MQRIRTRTRLGWMAALISLISLVASGAAAQQGQYTGHCRKLNRQIAHYEGVADMADAQGNPMWEAATLQHIDRLEARRNRLCPEYARNKALAATAKLYAETYALMKTAARTAVSYFTGGGL